MVRHTSRPSPVSQVRFYLAEQATPKSSTYRQGSSLVIYWIKSSVCVVVCYFEICTPKGRREEKGGNANFKTRHTETLTQEIPGVLLPNNNISHGSLFNIFPLPWHIRGSSGIHPRLIPQSCNTWVCHIWPYHNDEDRTKRTLSV